MKKAFIQKLSIAMASALVITAAAPAAPADAAAKMVMNRSSKILYLNDDNVTDTSDTYDFGIKNKPSGYKTKYSFDWYAENEGIVDVAKGGVVTAKKVGQTTVKCVITKKSTNKVVATAKAVVTVKANADSVVINNGPENGKMKVGSSYDFNRTMKAANGKKATDKTEWLLYADAELTKVSDIAKVDKNGNVTADKAGTFYIQARTYQSTATKDTTTAKSEAVKVEVVNTINELKAVKSNQVVVTFGDTVDYKANDYVLTNVATGARTYVKGVTSADKKVVTLDLYNNLVSGVTYKLAVGGMETTLDFVKGSVTTIVLNDQTIPANTASSIAYNVYDENGLDITADTTVNITSSIALDTTTKKITLGNGVISYVTVSYFDVNAKKTITSRTATITGSSAATTGIVASTIVNTGSTPDFSAPVLSIYKGQSNKTLYVQVTDQYGNKVTGASTGAYAVTYESLTPEILVVDTMTGALTAVAEGTAIVKVTANGIVNTVAITVQGAVSEASLSVSVKNGSLTNSTITGVTHTKNYPTITTDVLNQYGSAYDLGTLPITYTLVNGAGILEYNGGTLGLNNYNSFTANDNTTVTFKPLATGTATFAVSRGSLATQYVTVTVTGSNTATSKYSIEGLTTLNVANAWDESTSNSESTTLSLYTVNSNNEYIDEVTGADIKIVVTNPSGASTAVTGGAYALDKATVQTLATGTYTVVAYKNNVAVASSSFSVVDTTAAPTVTLSSNTITSGAVNTTTVGACLSIPSGYSLVGFKFTSSTESIVASPTNYESVVTLNGTGDVTLYNVSVQVKSTSNNRTYTISNLGNILVDR